MTDTGDSGRYTLGVHDAAIESIKSDVQDLKEDFRDVKKDVADIKLLLATTKGGVRALMSAGAIGAAVATLALKALPFVFKGN